MNAEERWRSASYVRRENMLVYVGITRTSAQHLASRYWLSLPSIIREKLEDFQDEEVTADGGGQDGS